MKGTGFPCNVTLYYWDGDSQQTKKRGVHINLNKIPMDIIKGKENYYLRIMVCNDRFYFYSYLFRQNQEYLEDFERFIKGEIIRKKNRKHIVSFFNHLKGMGLPCQVTLFRWNENLLHYDLKPCVETDLDNSPMDMIDSDKNYGVYITYSSEPRTTSIECFPNNQSDRNRTRYFSRIQKEITSRFPDHVTNYTRDQRLKKILSDTSPPKLI